MVGVRETGFEEEGGLVVFLLLLLVLLEDEGEEEEDGRVEVDVDVVGLSDEDGTKDMESVPENRMTDTARATGRTAVRGLG